ncbi:hypothetical protein GCM10011400_72580 [Paraburkholderia caffeinilytica]|uniref:Uncharacterized protein n=1 Tax=Paraburkholderia caffeinilytica TaxID=1761016 RepID=A0ABQ1NEI3_9BURK|nr:hypothetical protein GCM10011400_72580 [Paraburkholderia caffeinilytica]CAB3809435.1 hypothetical protein LMG28690_07292 [Paraburkholderia caffeinilytica]
MDSAFGATKATLDSFTLGPQLVGIVEGGRPEGTQIPGSGGAAVFW